MLLRNREIKHIIVIFLFIFIIFSIILQQICNMLVSGVNSIVIEQNTAAIGTLVKHYPELEEEIVHNYTVNYRSNYEYGKEVLKKYSYNESLYFNKNSSFSESYRKLFILSSTHFTVFALMILVFLLISLSRIYNKIRSFANNTEKIIEGIYSPVLIDTKEGDFGLLAYQLNILAERFNETLQRIREEKLFLKRTMTDISHQLKTPLASLIMFNDLMISDENMVLKDRLDFLQESKNAMDRIEWLIKNLMKMAKLEGKVVEFNKELLPIHKTIMQSVNTLQPMAEEKDITVTLNGYRETLICHDKNWTIEALSNIIKNCIEHSNEKTEIKISWEANSIFSQIIIEDNGTGIKKEQLPRIFDRFFKGANSSSPINIGIGLFITKTIIEGQGGNIYAVSKEGQGSKFIITFMKTN